MNATNNAPFAARTSILIAAPITRINNRFKRWSSVVNPPSRGDAPEDSNHSMILGELRGQMREMVHGLNNLSSKFDGLSREVIGLAALAKDVIEIKTQLAQETKSLREEIDALKAERDQRTGATNLISWVFKNWPGVLGFVALIAVILRNQGKL